MRIKIIRTISFGLALYISTATGAFASQNSNWNEKQSMTPALESTIGVSTYGPNGE